MQISAGEVGKREIVTPKLSDDKSDSLWYDGKTIAVFKKNNRKVIVGAFGDIAISVNDENGDEKCYIRNRNLDDLEECGIKSDTDLKRLEEHGRLYWANNNWFGYTLEKDGKKIPISIDVEYEYDDALEGIEEILDNDSNWM